MKGIAPYTPHITTKCTNVGDGLRTSRRKNNGIIFNRAPKVRRTFNHYVPLPRERG